MPDKSLRDLDLSALMPRSFFPSPAAWEDQVLYFLLVDRFSDENEGISTPLFQPSDEGNAVDTPEATERWRQAGGGWVGGTLKGLESKIGYLQRLGVTAIWVSPVFKQAAYRDSYHGYGIQNFLEVDPHFGTREDLRSMVRTAHESGIHVILDVILNHAGDVFEYAPDRYWTEDRATGQRFLDPRWDGGFYQVRGFRHRDGTPSLPFAPVAGLADAWPEGAVWPQEFQDPSTFSLKGRIDNWDYDPEYLEGDFFDLKNITLGRGPIDTYEPSPALKHLSKVYQFWIAYADIDGFRVDTVKHMDPGATRFFASQIHEFAQSLGKENFYLIGEITGGRGRAYETLEETGLNAALGIDDIPDKLEWLIKGWRDPIDYFDLFRNSLLVRKESHVWFRNKVVTLYDDHDQVRKGMNKARFCADDDGKRLALNALALNAMTLGIPCIYYGSEQCFDGHGGNDRYIRESMFGGEFGAFRSRGRHFFDESHPVYTELAKILEIRRRSIVLRRGRQYLRQVSGDGEHFGLPHMMGDRMRAVVPWSRIFAGQEVLLAVNTDPDHPQSAWVTIDNELHAEGGRLGCIYSTDAGEIGQSVAIESRNGKSVRLTAPAAGFVIYA